MVRILLLGGLTVQLPLQKLCSFDLINTETSICRYTFIVVTIVKGMFDCYTTHGCVCSKQNVLLQTLSVFELNILNGESLLLEEPEQLFYEPAAFVPVDALQGLFHRVYLMVCQQNPFGWLLSMRNRIADF